MCGTSKLGSFPKQYGKRYTAGHTAALKPRPLMLPTLTQYTIVRRDVVPFNPRILLANLL